MIIKLNRSVVRTCIAFGRLLCGAERAHLDPKSVSIVLRKCGPGPLECRTVKVDVGCGHTEERKRWERKPEPGIKYCAVEIDESGRACFMWDDKILKARPGMWNGEVFICDEFVGIIPFHLDADYVVGDHTCMTVDECPTTTCPEC